MAWNPQATEIANRSNGNGNLQGVTVANAAVLAAAGGGIWGQSSSTAMFDEADARELLNSFNEGVTGVSVRGSRFMRITKEDDPGKGAVTVVLKKGKQGIIVRKQGNGVAVVHVDDDGGCLGSVRGHFETIADYYLAFANQ